MMIMGVVIYSKFNDGKFPGIKKKKVKFYTMNELFEPFEHD